MTENYHDIDGNPVTLGKLCRTEPEWAANVIKYTTESLRKLSDAVGEYLSVVGVCSGAEGDDPLCGDPVCPYCRMALAAERCRTVLGGR